MMPEFEGTLFPDDSRTIRVLSIEVPRGTKQIVLDLTYEPRTVEDRDASLKVVQQVVSDYRLPVGPEALLQRFWPLRNLLNIGVFDSGGRFRGRWDRNRPEQHSTAVLSERGSDAGMLDGAIVPGIWKLCLEVHQILTPVRYALTVDTRDTPKKEYSASGIGRRSVEGTKPQALSPMPLWLKGDLHVHSEHSDGRQPVAEVYGALQDEGLDFFALTDHNTTSGLRDLPSRGVVTLPGLELTTFRGHATCLGISGFVPWYEGARVRPFAVMAAEVHAQGGLVCAAHPFAPPNPMCAGCRWEFTDVRWEDVDLLEIWNGDRDDHAPINIAALDLWNRLLNAGRRIPAVAGSDMHDVAHLKTRTYARTFVRAGERSAAGILDALRRGCAVVSCGPRIDLAVESGGRRISMGDTATVLPGAALTVSGAVEDAPAGAHAVLVANGSRIDQNVRWTHDLRAEHSGWLRAEVVKDGVLWAVTNPIYVDVIRDSKLP